MQRAFARGTAVHAFAEAHAYGEIINTNPAHSGYLDGIRQWYHEMQPTVLCVERRIVSRGYRLTGRIDLAVMLDGEPTIVDFASGTMPKHKGIQVAGYVTLAYTNRDFRDMAAGKAWQRAVLELPGNGRYHWYGQRDLKADDTAIFNAALRLVHWRFDHGLLTETDPERPDDDCQV